MSRIRSRNTRPELALRRALFGLGLRYRLHRRELPGTPDIVFVSARFAVQVRGCFWHLHPGCRQARIPLSRRDYWKPKLERNAARDEQNDAALRELGWRLHIVWGMRTQVARNGEVCCAGHLPQPDPITAGSAGPDSITAHGRRVRRCALKPYRLTCPGLACRSFRPASARHREKLYFLLRNRCFPSWSISTFRFSR